MRFGMSISIVLICAPASSRRAQNLLRSGTFDDNTAWTVLEHSVPTVITVDLDYMDYAPALGPAPESCPVWGAPQGGLCNRRDIVRKRQK